MSKTRILDHVLAFSTVFFWGLTFLSTKYLQEHFSSLEILFLRYAVAYLALWAMCPKLLKFCGWRREGMMFAAALTGAALYQFLENLSVEYTSPASVSFISSIAPLFVALFAHWFLSEPLNGKVVLGILLAIVGVFFICFGDASAESTGLVGDLIVFGAVWLWALYSVLVKKIAAYGYSDFQVTRRIFFYSLLLMAPFLIPRIRSFPYADLLSFDAWGNLLFLGVVASAFCFAMWNRSVEHLGAITTGKYMFIMPPITLLAQAILFRTPVSPLAIVGMALTLLGVAWTKIDFRRHTAKPEKSRSSSLAKEHSDQERV